MEFYVKRSFIQDQMEQTRFFAQCKKDKWTTTKENWRKTSSANI